MNSFEEMLSLPLFQTLKPEEKAFLTEGIRRGQYKKGELIHSHSDACIGILFLEKGRACATMLSNEGREAVLFRLIEGECCILSAACILRQVSFDVHIAAEKNSTLLVLPAKLVETVSNENCDFRCELYRLAAERFSQILRNLQGILFERVETRIARFLLEEARLSGSDDLSLTHETIAKYAGSAREVVTRTLTQFSGKGLVALKRGQIYLTDKAGLLALT